MAKWAQRFFKGPKKIIDDIDRGFITAGIVVLILAFSFLTVPLAATLVGLPGAWWVFPVSLALFSFLGYKFNDRFSSSRWQSRTYLASLNAHATEIFDGAQTLPSGTLPDTFVSDSLTVYNDTLKLVKKVMKRNEDALYFFDSPNIFYYLKSNADVKELRSRLDLLKTAAKEVKALCEDNAIGQGGATERLRSHLEEVKELRLNRELGAKELAELKTNSTLKTRVSGNQRA